MGDETVETAALRYRNPFRPGAGHRPPYLAGREHERQQFGRLLDQETILENLVLTGLRGVGKTVLLETFKPMALDAGWLWTGTDLSESISVSEANLAVRLLTDLAVITSTLTFNREEVTPFGLTVRPGNEVVEHKLTYGVLTALYESTPGLPADKLKATLRFAWQVLKAHGRRGVIFAYDEAQTLSDQAGERQYPLSLLLDLFQSIQKQDVPFMLALTGLPTLFPRLVEARTFAERMFRVVTIDRLRPVDSEAAIRRPVEGSDCPVSFDDASVRAIVTMSGGYPYFIQFICRECYDIALQIHAAGETLVIPVAAIEQKLDSDFFAGRWARATDRQRDLLATIAFLDRCDEEFSVQEIVESSRRRQDTPFSPSSVNQMLVTLANNGLVYKNRHGKYSLAVPLLSRFIRRQSS